MLEGRAAARSFTLNGRPFMAMDGGPHFRFDQGFSLFVSCQTQEEIDRLWGKLSEGGEQQMCGWVLDKYGISWQVVPTAMGELMDGSDPVRMQRVWEAMLKMRKLDIKGLQQAYRREVTGRACGRRRRAPRGVIFAACAG